MGQLQVTLQSSPPLNIVTSVLLIHKKVCPKYIKIFPPLSTFLDLAPPPSQKPCLGRFGDVKSFAFSAAVPAPWNKNDILNTLLKIKKETNK